MAQEIRIGEFTFTSTTDSRNITISDDMFAQMKITQDLINALNRLERKLR